MLHFPILSFLTFLPLIGALIVLMLPSKTHIKMIKVLTLFFTLVVFAVSLVVWGLYDPLNPGMQMIEKTPWFTGDHTIYYSLGIDGISIFFVLLTTLLLPICIISSWHSITKRIKEYMVCFLILETLILGSFLATDLLLFFLFFESVLIPMFLIIGVWGGENRVYAAFKFFLYTLFGSVFLLLAVIYIYFNAGTTDILTLNRLLPEYNLDVQKWLWLAFFASFAVKVPMWPVHTWLPDAHVQAPTAGSVILAGILLKLGGYGFLRFSLPMLPDASHYFANFVFILSIIAVIYTSLVALMQEDMKKLIAYSSVAHMGFVTAGIFAFNQQGISGAIFQMISHGLVSAALFLCVGVLYDRMHTKEIAFYNGVTSIMPRYAMLFMIFMLASVGLPGTSGFIGEFLVLLAVFEMHKLYSALIATGIILGAAYMLWLYARVMYGEVKNKDLLKMTDLNCSEMTSLGALAILTVFLGIYPSLVTDDIKHSISWLHSKITIEKQMINE